MASTRELTSKDGRRFYEIRVRPERGRSLSRRWYVPDGWSRKAIERELARVAAEFETQVRAGEVLTRSEKKEKARREAAEAEKVLTVRQYGERVFMPSVTVRLSERTREAYQGYLNSRVYPAIGDYPVRDVTAGQVSALLLKMQRDGLSCATVTKVYAVMSSMFKAAYMADMTDRNVMDKVPKPRPRKDEAEKELEAYTAQELRRIVSCLEAEPLKWRSLVWFLIDTGCRRGEAVGLQWSDIDFSSGAVTLQRTLNYTAARGVYVDSLKNRKQRRVDLSGNVLALLRELRADQAGSCLSKWVFTQGGLPDPMFPHSPTQYMNQLSKRYDIPGLHPHKLRHSFASIAITSGADVVSVSQKLGHSDTSVTLRVYSHANEESVKRAGEVFREALSRAGNE